MNVSPPIPWRDVPVGAVVLYGGTPRTVVANWENCGICLVLLEGDPGSHYPRADDTVQLVLLDDADAVANLAAAGLTIEPIGEQS